MNLQRILGASGASVLCLLAACSESDAGYTGNGAESEGGTTSAETGGSGKGDTPLPGVQEARAALVAIGESGVSGSVTFTAASDGGQVTGRITGLAPGQHGFHVHQYGDVSDTQDGLSAGGHFAPDGNPHGMPGDAKRHVGDLGNIQADAGGVAELDFRDPVIRLSGPHSILGRAIVVHAGVDDGSQPSGNAGGRVAFGVIGIANPTPAATAKATDESAPAGTGGGR